MGMAAAGDDKKGRATPQMNVTPLVDVVLVLLIIFMVVTPLLSKTFALNLPKKDDAVAPPSNAPNESLVLTVRKDGRIFVNQTQLDKSELGDRVRRLVAARSDKVVYFDAEDGTPYANAVEAMDIARGGGATTIAILTEKVTP